MALAISCPHCGKKLSVEERLLGTDIRCPSCRETINACAPQTRTPAPREATTSAPPQARRPAPAQDTAQSPVFEALPTPPAQTPDPEKRRRGKRLSTTDGTNVSTFWTGAMAAVATVLLYLVLFPALGETQFGVLFTERGWVPYVVVVLTAWSASILLLKWSKLQRQKKCLHFDVLPTELAAKISRESIDTFHGHVVKLSSRVPNSFLLNRVRTALAHFRSRGVVHEMAGLIESQAGIDTAAVQSSYALLKVFIWAIPILGFIGTVLGIGLAVGGFSESINAAQELDVIKTSLGSVTRGLAVAFDTTLVALIMSVLIMFPANSLQKAEEDLLNQIDEYCNENLLRRMDDESARSGDPEAIRQAIAEAFAEHKGELDSWSSQLPEIGSTLTRQVVSGWEEINNQLQESHKLQLQQVRDVLNATAEERRSFVTQVEAVQDSQVQQFSSVVASMGETAARIQQQIAEMQESQVRNSHDVVSSLAANLETLQREAHERYQADKADLNRTTQQFLEVLNGLKDDIRSTQEEAADGLRAVGSAVREEVGGLAGDVSETFRSQLGALDQVRQAVSDGARKLAVHMEEVRSVHAEGMADAASGFRDGVRSVLQQMAKSQEESQRRLQEIAASLAEQARVTQQQMIAAREGHEKATSTWAQQRDQMHADIHQSVRAQIKHLSAATEKIVASLAPNIEAALKKERQRATTDAAAHLTRVSAVGNEFVVSLVASQEKLDEHIARFIRILEGQQKLTAMQQALASNLELLATSDTFRQTLAGIDQSLNRLHAVLDSVGKRAGIIWPDGPSSDGRVGGLRRIMRRIKGGKEDG